VSDEGFDYPRLVQEALLGVVRRALAAAAERGLQGEHHFFLTFRTTDEGVVLPPRLRKRYPAEMTVVLQHQFFELAVDEESFSVSLKFGGSLERIAVPFAALTAFADPSVSFGLQFPRGESEPPDEEASEGAASGPAASGGRAEVFQFPREPQREEPPGES
jgi:hypothetical protein